jgi:hypothetical protein
MGQLRHTAPSLRLFVPNRLKVCYLPFLPWLCLQHRFHVGRLLPQRSFTNRYIRSLLRPARSERFPNQLPASPSYYSHPKLSSFLSITLPRYSYKFSPFSHFLFNTIILSFLLPLSLGAGAPTLPAPALYLKFLFAFQRFTSPQRPFPYFS